MRRASSSSALATRRLLRASSDAIRLRSTTQSIGRRPVPARAWRAFQTISE